jgi:hypothetical protein
MRLGYVETSLASGRRLRGWLEHDSNLDAGRDTPSFKGVIERLHVA